MTQRKANNVLREVKKSNEIKPKDQLNLSNVIKNIYVMLLIKGVCSSIIY